MNFKSPFGITFLALLFGAFAGFAQSISGFSPKFCSTNEFVQINGSGFTGVTNVIFYNGKSVRVTVTADNQIPVVVPFGATTGPIQVKAATSVDDLTIIGREPYITGWSPTSGSGGTIVTMTGVHFTGATNVSFNGLKGAITELTTDTQIKVSAPTNFTTGPISLTRSNLTGISSSNFFASPAITSFSPSVGRSGTNVVIVGKNFIGGTFVKFNGAAAPSFTVDSNTQITVGVPTNATTGTINISTPGGQTFSSSNFVVLPTIFSFSPFIGKQGTIVTIVGANLNGTTNVYFNGASASFSGTSNQLTATVPLAATSGPITVATTNGIAVSATNFFLPPNISGFTPTNGAAGTVVAISGVNFTNATDVSFNGVSANFGVVNNNSITSTVPVGAMSGPISVTAPGGTTNTAGYFWITPVVSSFTPGSGVVGTSVTITGSSFTNATAVMFNGVNATFTPGNNTQLTAIVPTNATTGPISVVAPGGTGVSAENFVIDAISLSIRLLTNGPVVISWTTNAVGFSLQANTNLISTNWVAVTNLPVVVSGKNTITNAPTNSATFYRLKK